MLFGVQATLAADRTAIHWDDPITLRLTLHNPQGWPVCSPLLVPPAQPISELAAHVGRLFDVVDYLELTGPDEQEVELHLDQMLDEYELRSTVARRVEEEPTSTIGPVGASASWPLVAFSMSIPGSAPK